MDPTTMNPTVTETLATHPSSQLQQDSTVQGIAHTGVFSTHQTYLLQTLISAQ